ncbi:MAG: AAA family ATPase [Gemmatimonadetes bacterium]|nr:AAA family ATPase [Gemmatimonadota bacterium]
MTPHPSLSTLPDLPLVGRAETIARLHRLFGSTSDQPPFFLVTGESGVGKTRAIHVVADEARRRGWTVAHGRAYPLETGMPYALLSDALLPLLQDLDDARLNVLTRGRASELRHLFPALGPAQAPPIAGEDPDEIRSRLYWGFYEFLVALGNRAPLLLVLEDLHSADPSSLSLLHFVARQLGEAPVRILASYNDDYRDANESLVGLERSLLGMRGLERHPIPPLTSEQTLGLVESLFGVSGQPLRAFGQRLYGWTLGNAFFIEQILVSLVDSGQLHQRDGLWLGWESRELRLPGTVRDAIRLRLTDLGEAAHAVAECLAVVGAPASARLLTAVSGVNDAATIEASEELLRRGLIEERDTVRGTSIDFRHPLVRETVYRSVSAARRETLHRAIGEALESSSSDSPDDHIDRLAYHFSRSGLRSEDTRPARYLALSGRAALARHANREAAAYLSAALTHGAHDRDGKEHRRVRHDLARARSRLGDFDGARELWMELGAEARERADGAGIARSERYLGALAYWRGQPREAVRHYEAALDAVDDDDPLRARLDLAAGVVLQEVGDAEGSRERLTRALALGEETGNTALQARAHRGLALLETWIGAPDEARRHGWQAVELSRSAGDPQTGFWARWALAALEGLTGDTAAMDRLMTEARAIADDLQSPVLGLWIAELDVELAYARGDWDGALARGEQAIRLADLLQQRTLRTRLQVWTAMVYLGRGDWSRAQELVDDAWASAVGAEATRVDLHAAVPAHIGRAALHLARGDFAQAIEIGERGLELADRSGYVVWVLHRLLPIVAEAHIRADNLDRARDLGERLRFEGHRIGHRLGLAWAEACDAILAYHGGDAESGARLLRSAAEGLEAVPMIPEAARLRRQLAGRLADLGDREGALVELRLVHDVFGQLAATPELTKARGQFRELGARPPSRSQAEGTAVLTGRELEVARLVADRLSNKAIARALDVSPRTVTTHLSNIYRKLDISSRGDLADRVREGRLVSVHDPDTDEGAGDA